MSEQQIKDGYEAMGAQLMPPPDTLERVTRAVRTRRRRRTALTTGAALATVVVAGGIAWSLQGSDGTGTQVAQEPPPAAPMTLTRADGTTFAFTDVTVSCEPPPGIGANDTVGSGPDRIWLSSPMKLEGSAKASDDDAILSAPFLYFEGRVDKIDGKTFTLPVDSFHSSENRPFTLFVADGRGKPSANEVSSAEAGAKGTVHVVRASCDPTPVLELVVDTTLGSEVNQGTEQLAGSYP